MNLLIILPEELCSPDRAVITGERALYVLGRHELSEGLSLSAGLLGGERGRAIVEELSADQIVLKVDLCDPPLVRCHVELIVAVPRPQTVKKTLQLASTLGITALHFVRSANVEKSYLQSKTLKASRIQSEVILGLEQSCDTISPHVHVHRHFSGLLKEVLPTSLRRLAADKPLCLIADTRSEVSLADSDLSIESATQPVFLAVGPEAGWSEEEVERFAEVGFKAIGLGERMLRVETAIAVLLGQVMLLRDQAS